MRTDIRSFTRSRRTFLLSLAALWTLLLSGSAAGQVDVWIDPGHCCTGTGASGYNGQAPHEKDLAFAVADYLQATSSVSATSRTRQSTTARRS